MKIETSDCVEAIINHFLEKGTESSSPLLDSKQWKRISKTGTGDNIIRKFQNKITSNEIYVVSSDTEIFNVSKIDTFNKNIITNFDNFNTNIKKSEKSDRVFVTSYGRDMFKDCLEVYIKNNNVLYQDVKDEMKNCYGFQDGDIVNIINGHPIGDAQILKMKYDEYGGSCVLKSISPTNNSFVKKGELIKGYALSLLGYATLVTPVSSNTIIPKIKKEKSKKSKYILEVEDFSISKIDWQKETYSDYDINIGITVYVKGEDYMYDDEVLPELPELEELELGEIQMDDNGFIGITSELSVVEIKKILSDNGFTVK